MRNVEYFYSNINLSLLIIDIGGVLDVTWTDAGFTASKDRADECKESEEDNYIDSWDVACKSAG